MLTTGCFSEEYTLAPNHGQSRGNVSAVAGPFQGATATGLSAQVCDMSMACLFLMAIIVEEPFITLLPTLSLASFVTTYLLIPRTGTTIGKIKGKNRLHFQNSFYLPTTERARDDQMFGSISFCETFEKTHSNHLNE